MATLGTDDTDTMQRVNMSVCLCVGMNKLHTPYVYYIGTLGRDDVIFHAFGVTACVYHIVVHIQVNVCEYILLTIHYCLVRLRMNLYNCRERKHKSNNGRYFKSGNVWTARRGMLAHVDGTFLPIVSEQVRPNRRLSRPHTAGLHFH